MLSRDKRASLSSNLLGGKEPSAAAPQQAPASEVETTTAAEEEAVTPPANAEQVLYSKGAASASGFRPWYWSYDNKESAKGSDPAPSAQTAGRAPISAPTATRGPAPPPKRGTVTRFPVTAATASSSAAALPRPRPKPASEIPKKSFPLSLMLIGGGVGCLALLGTGFFLLSGSPEPAAAPAVAAAPSTASPPPAGPTVAPSIVPTVAAPTVSPAPVVDNHAPATPPPNNASPTPSAPAAAELAPRVVAAAPPSPAEAPAAAEPRAETTIGTNEDVAELLRHGDQLLSTGDIVAARAFYVQAADRGSAAAAAAVGKTFDPLFLDQSGARGIRGDPATAMRWYRKAVAAGDRSADAPLRRLIARFPG